MDEALRYGLPVATFVVAFVVTVALGWKGGKNCRWKDADNARKDI